MIDWLIVRSLVRCVALWLLLWMNQWSLLDGVRTGRRSRPRRGSNSVTHCLLRLQKPWRQANQRHLSDEVRRCTTVVCLCVCVNHLSTNTVSNRGLTPKTDRQVLLESDSLMTGWLWLLRPSVHVVGCVCEMWVVTRPGYDLEWRQGRLGAGSHVWGTGHFNSRMKHAGHSVGYVWFESPV